MKGLSGINRTGVTTNAQPEKSRGYLILHATSAVFRDADPEIVGFQSLFV